MTADEKEKVVELRLKGLGYQAIKFEADKITFTGYKMSRPNVQKILYKNVQLVCLF